MEAELMALASSGAATLVGLMVSDAWTEVKDGIARMLARGRATEQVAHDLDVSRAELLQVGGSRDGQLLAAVEGEWRARLQELLQAEPALAEDLRRLLTAGDMPKAWPLREVHNVITGGVQHGPVIQAGRVSGLAFHLPKAPEGADGDEVRAAVTFPPIDRSLEAAPNAANRQHITRFT
ncbi:hypothetical protein [Microbispora bryophytorum]|uniref:hypothetical protein n=1 Tax=Microbispora bryophytorum TaxID=1460882 RepID=UPI00166C6D8A|nr:hypothetical protein [Microbispora bryophytorum]MBD3140731.1 hypothetical protein [Microbispora bryophytorum]